MIIFKDLKYEGDCSNSQIYADAFRTDGKVDIKKDFFRLEIVTGKQNNLLHISSL